MSLQSSTEQCLPRFGNAGVPITSYNRLFFQFFDADKCETGNLDVSFEFRVEIRLLHAESKVQIAERQGRRAAPDEWEYVKLFN